MRNDIFDKLTSTVRVVVEGKNVNNYIKRLVKNKVDIIDLKYIDYSHVDIIIKYCDYLNLKDNRTIYKLKIVEKYGNLKLKYKLMKNYILFIFLIMGFFIIYFLSNVIFDIEIIHTSNEIVELMSRELKKYGIEKFKMKKEYDEIEKIEDKILEENKTKLEWIEIEEVGTKYIIRIEERKIKENNVSNDYQDIVISKSGILKKIIAKSGEKVKEINTFVKKGDVVIKGSVTKPNGENIYVSADGEVYANVWYTIDVEYPYHYKEEILTGKNKNVYFINFFNKRISLFDFNKFNSFQSNPKVIMYDNIMPISFVKERQYEVNVIDEIYTDEQIILKATELAESRLLSSNSKIDYIDEVTIVKKEDMGSKINLKLFLSVVEEVSEVKKINIDELVKENKDS